MSVGLVLYTILIKPLETLFDFIFYRSYYHFVNAGLSIIILSLVVNFLALPLYRRADKMQAEESEKRFKIKKWEDHIKKNFKGYERFMMLQTYYRQNDYKPYQTLKSAMPLLLEIPFFIAAYHFLSNLPLIDNASFGPLKNLGAPDGLLKISGITINVLPVIMTVINIISGTVYNRTVSFKDKIQTYILALVFLVLLYKSPSGLVFYWTLNNIFSLCKNIVYRLKPDNDKKKDTKKEKNTFGFLVSASLLAIFTGMYIPTTIVKSSVEEFIDIIELENPVNYIILSFCLAAGFFVVWLGVFFFLSSDRFKRISCRLISSLAFIAMLEYLVVPENFRISQKLVYLNTPVYSVNQHIQGVVIFVATMVLCFYVYGKKKNLVISLIFSALAIFTVISIYNLNRINGEYDIKSENLKKYNEYPEIHLSKNGKNVMVIMMDRMVSYFIPYLFTEKPELYDRYDGFTYYPNCVSFGTATNTGSPALYGGYDYTPLQMNARTDMLLEEKHNEALKVMPVLFDKENYDVTVCDPSYAGYDWKPDLSIYDEYPNISKYITEGRMSPEEYRTDMGKVIKRNLFFYGILRSSPTIFRDYIYNYGYYNSAIKASTNEVGDQTIYSLSKASGLSTEYYDSYCVLASLPSVTSIDDSVKGSFLMMSNNTTHSDTLLQEPDYEPSLNVDNTEFDTQNPSRKDWDGNILSLYNNDGQMIYNSDGTTTDGNMLRVLHYHINMSALLILADYFDYLKAEGVYDNTKIIIVSDHSAHLGLETGLMCVLDFEDGRETVTDLLGFQSTLLVKDFNSTGFKVDDRFMTNADVPSIATEGVIENAKNPFTNNPLSNDEKNNEPVWLIATKNFRVEENNGYKFMPEQWFSVHDNIFEGSNWSYEGYH